MKNMLMENIHVIPSKQDIIPYKTQPDYSTTLSLSCSGYGKVYFSMMLWILGDMEKYLENIQNSPSTINRLIGYYHYARNPDEPLKEYLVFAYNGKVTIIKEYDLKKETDRQIKKSFEKIGY